MAPSSLAAGSWRSLLSSCAFFSARLRVLSPGRRKQTRETKHKTRSRLPTISRTFVPLDWSTMPMRIATSHPSVAAASVATASRRGRTIPRPQQQPHPVQRQPRPQVASAPGSTRRQQPTPSLDDPRIQRQNAELRRRLRDAKPRALALGQKSATATGTIANATVSMSASERPRATPSLHDYKIRKANAALRQRIRNATSRLAGLFRRSDGGASTTSSATTAASTASVASVEIDASALERIQRECDVLAAHDADAVEVVASATINADIGVDIEIDWEGIESLVGDITASSIYPMSLAGLSDDDAFSLPIALTQRPQEESEARPLQLEDIHYGRILGKGAFATVVLAYVANEHQEEDGHLYALKVMDKDLIYEKQAHYNVLAEKHALLSIPPHPNVLQLHATFHDHHNLYLLTDLVSGGELYDLMRQVSPYGLPIHAVRFFAANIILGLQHIHAHDFVFRDLKAENLILGHDGYLTFVDFGFAKHLSPVVASAQMGMDSDTQQQTRAFTMCGTPEYMAPEIFTRRGYDRAVDWWAFGVLVYEMLVGETPFVDPDGDDHQYHKLLANIACKGATNHRLGFPQRIRDEAPEACDFVERLLQADPQRRLGMQHPDEVRQHAWFQGLDWDALLHKHLEPPHVPTFLQRRLSLDNDQDSDFDADQVRVSQFKCIEHAPLDPNDQVDSFFADF